MLSIPSLTILVAGVVIGLLLGLTGGGGSILTVPLLVYIVGLEAKTAIATSMIVVGLASLSALLPHSRAGNVYWRTGIMFGLAGMAGAYSGGWVAQFLPDVLLLLLFATVMVGSGVGMLRARACQDAPADDGPSQRHALRILADGFMVGTVTGLVGAGGGFLIVPALALLGGLPMHAAVGTSLLVIAMNCAAGLSAYISHVPIDDQSAVIVGSLAIVGTFVGSRLSRLTSPARLRRGFGIFVLVVAAILIVIEGSSVLALASGLDRHTSGGILAGVELAAALGVMVRRYFSGSSQAHPLA